MATELIFPNLDFVLQSGEEESKVWFGCERNCDIGANRLFVSPSPLPISAFLLCSNLSEDLSFKNQGSLTLQQQDKLFHSLAAWKKKLFTKSRAPRARQNPCANKKPSRQSVFHTAGRHFNSAEKALLFPSPRAKQAEKRDENEWILFHFPPVPLVPFSCSSTVLIVMITSSWLVSVEANPNRSLFLSLSRPLVDLLNACYSLRRLTGSPLSSRNARAWRLSLRTRESGRNVVAAIEFFVSAPSSNEVEMCPTRQILKMLQRLQSNQETGPGSSFGLDSFGTKTER